MAARFAHEMPFGAAPQGDGVRFRIWAPSQKRMSVAVEGGPVLPMSTGRDGWFELLTDAARPGSRYRFELQDGMRVPDPASRFQPEDVHGPSVVVDPGAYAWRAAEWRGRPWEETILYELHVGAFGPEGTFDGVRRRLDHLASVGVTALELMPLSDFPGARNWGYDGVLPYAPDAAYGTPEELKGLVDAAHDRGLMVFLDVVYNHFGPEGNYLNLYAADFFDPEKHTPWGAAINYAARPVRDFVVNNALYWLMEYRFDGLRFDAVDQIVDESTEHLLVEMGRTIRERVEPGRHVHLVLENDRNQARMLERGEAGRPRLYTAQWNDDIHHVLHHLLTGESGGYYADFGAEPHRRLARALATGFVYQGEASAYRGGEPRGEPSGHLPPTAFVGFVQNHDQIGNRAFGERLTVLADRKALRAMTAVLLLAPHVPLLFMGEEWGATEPFRFFTDFHDHLADAVREGRRREFARFPEFADPQARERIPDPNSLDTFEASRLDWTALDQGDHTERLDYVRRLLRLRRAEIVPRLAGVGGGAAEGRPLGREGVDVLWRLADGARLHLLAALGDAPAPAGGRRVGRTLFESEPGLRQRVETEGALPPWSVLWLLDGA